MQSKMTLMAFRLVTLYIRHQLPDSSFGDKALFKIKKTTPKNSVILHCTLQKKLSEAPRLTKALDKKDNLFHPLFIVPYKKKNVKQKIGILYIIFYC